MTTFTETIPCLEEATILIRKYGALNPKNGCSLHNEEHVLAFAEQLVAAKVAFWNCGKLVAVPIVGMGATHLGYTDRHPFEVVAVHTSKKISLRAMKAELDPNWKRDFHPGGFCGHTSNNDEQKWTLTSNPADTTRVVVRLHKDGYWYNVDGRRYCVGVAVKFHDYNF